MRAPLRWGVPPIRVGNMLRHVDVIRTKKIIQWLNTSRNTEKHIVHRMAWAHWHTVLEGRHVSQGRKGATATATAAMISGGCTLYNLAVEEEEKKKQYRLAQEAATAAKARQKAKSKTEGGRTQQKSAKPSRPGKGKRPAEPEPSSDDSSEESSDKPPTPKKAKHCAGNPYTPRSAAPDAARTPMARAGENTCAQSVCGDRACTTAIHHIAAMVSAVAAYRPGLGPLPGAIGPNPPCL